MKTSLILGASRGIGRAIRNAFRERGDDVHDPGRGLCDLSVPSDPYILAGELREMGVKKLDYLVVTAAIPGPTLPLGAQDIGHIDNIVATNLLGVVHVCRAMIGLIGTEGSIVLFAGGGLGGPNLALHRTIYVATKAAVAVFSEALAAELTHRKIRVNCLAPGMVATEMTGGRGDPPDHVVQAVSWLCSDASEGITGRFFAAKWDFPVDRMVTIQNPSLYRLRRIDQADDWVSDSERLLTGPGGDS